MSVWTEASLQWPTDAFKDSRGMDVAAVCQRQGGRTHPSLEHAGSYEAALPPMETEMQAALRQSRELKFWDAPRIPWPLPPNGLRVPGGCPTNM